MARHYSDDGDNIADHAQVRGHLADIAQDDWNDWRTPTEELAEPDTEADPEGWGHTHYVAEDDWTEPVEDGDQLREFTEDGEVDRGHFGDGNFVPPHWWNV